MSSPQEQLIAQIRGAIEQTLGLIDFQGEIPIERPKNRDHGDYASSIALQLAKQLGRSPREVASLLQERLIAEANLAKVEIAGPGFINFTLNRSSQAELVKTIINAGKSYGHSQTLSGISINIEFISANPTGPLHLGHTRWAAVGDALARVLIAAGAKVTREFYINDRGVQMELFGESVRAAALGKAIPEEGYQGAYISEIAKQLVTEDPQILKLPEPEQIIEFRERAYKYQLADQQRVLQTFNTQFDVWFSERSLHESGAVTHGLEQLKKKGHVFESEGATWLRTTDFGDDKDRVLLKADGTYTYFTSDTAYYINKRERGFDICIYLLGADHHGYVGRLKAVAQCNEDQPDKVEVLIGQLVKIMKNGQEVKLSKRAGTIITLEDIVEEVGVDAARYTLIRYPTDSPMVMDVEVLKSRTNENPVYYVQYAHARIAGVLRNGEELGIKVGDFKTSELIHEREVELLGSLSDFPIVVATAAELREAHRVARYLEELAGVYHRFYADCRVLPMGEEPVSDLHMARLNLCAATRQVLENGLSLLGVSAPERM
ncbi:MAG: arginine--tRNA ligase [Candidatus Nanopelagicaceae bacterium]